MVMAKGCDAFYYLIFCEEDQVFTLLEEPRIIHFTDFIALLGKKIPASTLKAYFSQMSSIERFKTDCGIIIMEGARPNETELQTARKIDTYGYYVVFPGEGHIKNIKLESEEKDN
jgi:hypothetical protein